MALSLNSHGLRRKSQIFLLMAIAMAMIMTSKTCLSFVFKSSLSKKSISTKNLSIGTRLFSSSSDSTDITESGTNGRCKSFSVPKRAMGPEEDRRYKDLLRASKLQLAPMMEYTDRHFRHLVRLISGETLLYTEMVAANALAHERADSMKEYERLVAEDPSATSPPTEQEIRENYPDQYLQRFLNQGRIQPLEGPSVLQLGGSDPAQLYQAAQTVMDMVRPSQNLLHFLLHHYEKLKNVILPQNSFYKCRKIEGIAIIPR